MWGLIDAIENGREQCSQGFQLNFNGKSDTLPLLNGNISYFHRIADSMVHILLKVSSLKLLGVILVLIHDLLLSLQINHEIALSTHSYLFTIRARFSKHDKPYEIYTSAKNSMCFF